MLYHLIDLNPGKDMTLHVSTNNSAMVSPEMQSISVVLNLFSASLQPIRIQGGRIRGGILRPIPRLKLERIQKRLSPTPAPPLVNETSAGVVRAASRDQGSRLRSGRRPLIFYRTLHRSRSPRNTSNGVHAGYDMF